MKVGNLYESSDGDIYEIVSIVIGDIVVKVVKESETRRPDPLGTERTWFEVDFQEMISAGEVWKVSQIPVRVNEDVEVLSTKTQKIKPEPNCPHCHGNGEVFDIVPWGSTTTSMASFCECVEAQADEDTDEIELDLSGQ